MKKKRAMSLGGLTLCLAGTAVLLGGCSSVPKPAEADGSTRVSANDPARIQALQQRVSAERALLTENNLLRAQVDALQIKLNEMTNLVRQSLTLPPPAVIPPPQAVVPTPLSMATPQLPAHAYSATPDGVVIRVFHPFARTEFEPDAQVAEALRTHARAADQIEVRGHTDSNVVNPVDKMIAIERAERARNWLISNGVEASKIRTKYFTAGNFLTENRTPDGRSLNRRVEVETRIQQLAANKPASNQ